MNIVDLNPILEELDNLSLSQEKTAADAEQETPLVKQAAEIAAKLRDFEAPVGGVDFHTQCDMMQKKASSIARDAIGLDSRRTGNPTAMEVAAIVFGGM